MAGRRAFGALLVILGVLACAATLPSGAAAQSCGDGLLRRDCPPPPQCSDGVDNDRDAVRDNADLGCTDPTDTNEWNDVAPDPGGNSTVDVNPRVTGKLFGFSTGLSEWNGTPPNPSSGVSVKQETALIRAAGGNAHRLVLAWRRVEPSRGYRDAAEAAGAGFRWTWRGNRAPPVTIDRVLVPERAGVLDTTVHELERSDHRAVAATVALPAR
jgi:hypothetical protein